LLVESEGSVIQVLFQRGVPGIELSDAVTETETFSSSHEGSVRSNGTLGIAVLGVHLGEVGNSLDLVVVDIFYTHGVAVNSLNKQLAFTISTYSVKDGHGLKLFIVVFAVVHRGLGSLVSRSHVNTVLGKEFLEHACVYSFVTHIILILN
jgi:hypothetical protein